MNSAASPCCARCRHFNGRPLEIEAALPGLSSLSSGYASVRDQDGLCALHDRYVAARSVCALIALMPEPWISREPAPELGA
jgi:hypothetical protein